jgi:L-fuconolactonase
VTGVATDGVEGIVDAHHHVWELGVRDQEWISGPRMAPLRRDFTMAQLRPQAAAVGVRASVLVQTVCVPEETPELLALAHDDPLVAGVVGWTDLTSPDVADALAALREGPGGGLLVGIRHQVQEEADPRWLLRPHVLRGLAAVADAGLAYDLVVVPEQLPAAVAAARAVPGLRFVLDHLGKPRIAQGELEPWAGRLTELAGLPNVSCKLSGLVTEAHWRHWTPAALRPYVDTAMEAFGAGRLMFGSDWPVCLLAAGYGQVLRTVDQLTRGLSAAERASLFAGTARRVYGL